MKRVFNFCLIVFIGLYFSNFVVKASSNYLDQSNILDDLVSSDSFKLEDYPKNPYGKVEVISFIEFCYSDSSSVDYGLYVYVYNPNLLDFVDKVHLNKIQIGISADEEGNIIDFRKFPLQLINKSEDKLFYKFRVVDTTDLIYQFVKKYSHDFGGKRIYFVSGIELCESGKSSSVEYNVSTRYEFFGFAKGYGDYENFPLNFSAEKFESIELNVYQTYYRTLSSYKGAGYRHQLNSVYFAVPNYYFEEYGKLQRIKAEWYEFKTRDIIITSHPDFYERALGFLGIEVGYDYWEQMFYGLRGKYETSSQGDFADFGYNLGLSYFYPAMDTLYYLFYTNNIENYDPARHVDGSITSDLLMQYIFNYNQSYKKGFEYLSDRAISADLFEDDIDDYRKLDNERGKIQYGYSYYDFDADLDYFEMVSWQDGDPSFWDNLFEFGLIDSIFGRVAEDEGFYDISPIYILKSEDFVGSHEEVSKNLLINFHDVDDLESFYYHSLNQDKSVVLFRFARSDYYSQYLDICEPPFNPGSIFEGKVWKNQAYRAWQSVFLGFDVIQLSFHKNGKLFVFPVISNPEDIISPIDPPISSDDDDILKWIFRILIFIVALIVFAPLIPLFLKGIIWIILLPFKLIFAIFDSGRRKRKYRYGGKR